MSTVPSEATLTTEESLPDIPDYPGADIILRSRDSHHLRVPKIFVIHNSPVLDELVRATLASPGDTDAEDSLPVVELPESGKILRHLLTFVLPLFPVVPPTHEETMELLSVGKKYQMEVVLVYIRSIVALQNPLPTKLEPALHIYSLAQKYGLRPEALRSARTILKYPMTIEDLGDKLGVVSGASLYELWKYYERVRTILTSDLAEFRVSGARGTMTGLNCPKNGSFQIPSWVDQYIVSMGNAPNLFNFLELNIAMTRHIKDGGSRCDDCGSIASENCDRGSTYSQACQCGSISSQTIHKFWEALESVVNGSFEKAESGLSLVREREDPPVRTNSPTSSPPDTFNVPDANLIIQTSDLVNFRVHKSVLAMVSPVFNDMFSIPQPSDGESVDGLPVVRLSEDSDVLNTLVSMLYPLRPVIPKSYEKVLYLLAACQKYEMVTVQSSIRGKVSQGEFPAPNGAETFPAYLIARSKGLILETERAAHQTLDHPMTFEIFGEGLRLSEGWALRDLFNFRKRYRDNLMSCLKSFPNTEESQFNIWTSCHPISRGYSSSRRSSTNGSLPSWLTEMYRKHINESQGVFSKSLFNSRSVRGEYLSAVQAHINSYDCFCCTKVHAEKGETFCKNFEDRLTQVLNEALSDLR